MNTAIVHCCGLGTDPAGDCCGMRSFWEAIASLIGATFTAIGWADPDARTRFQQATAGAEAIYCSGHSHGANLLHQLLTAAVVPKVEMAAFLDLAPPADPLAWMGRKWITPVIAVAGLWFWQRNDAPLCGVAGGGGINTEAWDVTAWGLHHSDMCGDSRVQSIIKERVLWRHISLLREFYKKVGAT